MLLGKRRICKFILFWLVLLPIYQDSPLSAFLGAAGHTFIMPLSLLLIVLYIFLTSCVPKNKYLFGLVKLGVWLVVVSYISIIVWLILGNHIIIASELLPVKAFKVCLQYFSYPSYVALILITARKAGTESIGKFAFITLIILTIICIIETTQLPYAFKSLHFSGQFPYWRIRLLTMESSWTAMMIYAYTFLTLFWIFTYQKKIQGAIGITCATYLFWLSSSKALMMSVAVVAVAYVIAAFKKLNKRSIILLLLADVFFVSFVQFLLPQLSLSFQIDIRDYTSTATRLYTSILGLLIGILFPVGVGGAVYLGIFQSALSNFIWIFNKLPIRLNTVEIMNLATRSDDVALTVKSGILHNNMYWGICGTIYLIRNFGKLSKAISTENLKNGDLLLAAFWTTVILLFFSSDFSFEFWLVYSFLVCIEEETRRNYAKTKSCSHFG